MLQRLIDEASRIVFFGGAGGSTESGIPDFRSVDGLYSQKYDRPPEEILSHTYFKYYTEEFFRFYRDKMLYLDARPNDCHIKLAKMEKAGKLLAVVTQNIDGLHQKAGSKTVYELHGTVHKNHCTRCKKEYGVEKILDTDGVPRCGLCGGVIKPDVVLYEESLPERALSHAISAIRAADLLIIGGTSMTVYPAAGLVEHFRKGKIVLINRDPTAYDGRADLIIRDRIGQVFSKIQV